jgi:hypothetical protein
MGHTIRLFRTKDSKGNSPLAHTKWWSLPMRFALIDGWLT